MAFTAQFNTNFPSFYYSSFLCPNVVRPLSSRFLGGLELTGHLSVFPLPAEDLATDMY